LRYTALRCSEKKQFAGCTIAATVVVDRRGMEIRLIEA
jgi:hypothetical protein